MAWPDHIIKKFERVNPDTTDETEWYGPYNALLNYLFPSNQNYTVIPRFKGPERPGSVDHSTVFTVWKENDPVFFMVLKPRGHLVEEGFRSVASDHMRERFMELVECVVLPKLFAISTMGTRLAIHDLERDTLCWHPWPIDRDTVVVNDRAPASRWEYDLLEAGGEAKFREIVDSIKTILV